MLLDESAVEELPVEDLVAALGGGVHEPRDDPQRAFLRLVLGFSGLPHQHVVIPERFDGRGVAALDGGEQPVGNVGDDVAVTVGIVEPLLSVDLKSG